MMSEANENPSAIYELATLGGGCFWCLEAIYQQLNGIETVTSGYAGGGKVEPTYHAIGGHAEVVQLRFNPLVISYKDILEVFFTIHDPTTLNRQGADVGTQYRSIILYHSPNQDRIIKQVFADLLERQVWSNPIVTEIKPYDVFYKAEDYHQNYYRDNYNQPYCRMVIDPKVTKFRKAFFDKLKKEA